MNARISPLALTISDAAEAAGVSTSTIRRAIASGQLKAAKLGTAVRVRLADLDVWLAAAAGSDERAVVPVAVEVTA